MGRVWVLVLPFKVVTADSCLSKGEENCRTMKLETNFATQKSGHKEGEGHGSHLGVGYMKQCTLAEECLPIQTAA